MEKIEKAKMATRIAHSAVGQKRKFTGIPYWYHCRDVVELVEGYAKLDMRYLEDEDLEDIICAAWLHDTVEDTKITTSDIYDLFGHSVSDFVDYLTKKETNEETNKKLAAGNREGIFIKLADTLANLIDVHSELLTDFEKSKDFAVKFSNKKKTMIESVFDDGFASLVSEFEHIGNAIVRKIEQIESIIALHNKKKYEFTGEEKDGLKRIRALRAFGSVRAGDIGGWIESEDNLSHDGDCWVGGDAQVYGRALVSGNALVFGYARVSGNARVFGDAQVSGDAIVYGKALVFGNAQVFGYAQVFGDANVCDYAE